MLSPSFSGAALHLALAWWTARADDAEGGRPQTAPPSASSLRWAYQTGQGLARLPKTGVGALAQLVRASERLRDIRKPLARMVC